MDNLFLHWGFINTFLSLGRLCIASRIQKIQNLFLPLFKSATVHFGKGTSKIFCKHSLVLSPNYFFLEKRKFPDIPANFELNAQTLP